MLTPHFQQSQHEDTNVVVAFGDFTEEETLEILRQVKIREASIAASTKTDAPSAPRIKSWAQAVGGEKASKNPWTSVSSSSLSNQQANGEPSKASKKERLTFEKALQRALQEIDFKAPVKEMKKRGLVNQGNTCFQNVIMQCVLACPPLLNLLADISESTSASDAELLDANDKRLKAWRHLVAFIRQFEEPTVAQLAETKSLRRNDQANQAIRMSGFLMELLSLFTKMKGQQEDALEFLEFFLEMLHSEYDQSGLQLPSKCRGTGEAGGHAAAPSRSDLPTEDSWSEVVGKRGKSAVVNPHVGTDTSDSPISWLFKGFLRCEVKQSGKKQPSITIEPFHCLHLNLEQDDGYVSVGLNGSSHLQSSQSPSSSSHRLHHLPASPPTKSKPSFAVEEMIQKVLSVELIESDASTTNSPPSYASISSGRIGSNGPKIRRSTSLEALPVVLILSVKRFTYHPEQGPVKLQQFVKYPVELSIPTKLMSASCRAHLAHSTNSRGPLHDAKYRLFAVVSHHGKFVVGGHYTCVCRDNKDQWFQFDDEHVTSITEAAALKENAYLLLYMREF